MQTSNLLLSARAGLFRAFALAMTEKTSDQKYKSQAKSQKKRLEPKFSLFFMGPEGFEPTTKGL